MTTRRDFLGKVALGGIGGILASQTPPAFLRNLGTIREQDRLQEAREIHERCLIFDGHNDTPVERVARGMDVSTMMEYNEHYQTDYPRMSEVGYDTAAFIIGNGRIANVWVTMEQTLSMIQDHPDKLLLALEPGDILEAQNSDRVAVMMAIEGIAKWIHGQPDILRMLHRNGVRMVALTHGEGGPDPEFEQGSNPLYRRMRSGPTQLQGSRSPYRLCTPQERAAELRNAIGLTQFGEEILDLNNELGIVTDLTHINDRAYFDVLERTSKPTIVTHTAVFSLCNHFRCLTDDQIRALADNGGALGVCFVSQFLKEDPEEATLETMAEHIAHVVDLVGVEHVGIGTDFDGVGTMPVVVPELSELAEVTRELLDYGFSEPEIRKIWGENFLRVWQENHTA